MIYFAFAGSADEFRASGISLGESYEFVAFGAVLFGFVDSNSYKVRSHIDQQDKRLVSLPGPTNGKLAAKHLAIIGAELPQAKEGDAMSTVLQSIFTATNHSGFDPNNY